MLTVLRLALRSKPRELVALAAVVFLCVTTLVGARSLSTASAENGHDLAHDLGRNLLVLPAGLSPADFATFRFGPSTMPQAHADRVVDSPLGQHISALQARLYGAVRHGDQELIVVGDASLPSQARGAGVPALLGAEVARRLDLATGDTLVLGDTELSVHAVLPRPPDGLDLGVFVPLPTAQAILDAPDGINALRMGGCWCSLDVEALASDVEDLLPGVRAFTAAGVVDAQQGVVSSTQRHAQLVSLISLLLIAAVTAAYTTAWARRRRGEIGLLLAMGATPMAVTGSLVVAVCAATLLGALPGGALGLPLATGLASKFAGASITASPVSWLGELLLVVLTSTLAALLPAVHAATLDPVEALREV